MSDMSKVKEKQTVYLVGIGMGNAGTLTCAAEEILKTCDCLIGARRMADSLIRFEKPIFPIYKPQEIHECIQKHQMYQKIAIVLSGDPGFYSGAKKIMAELAEYSVYMIPGVSSISYLASRLGTSWEDGRLISVHGRWQNYIQIIAHNRKNFLLLDQANSGRDICEKLNYYGLGDVNVTIGKNLSYENEEIIVKKGSELIPEDFWGLCVAMIENPNANPHVCRHIKAEEFIRGKVPMTKDEVRAVSLAKLELSKDAVLYDVGSGTGSVAIEAALQSEYIKVYAVEKNPEGIALIEQNKQKFCTDQVTVIEGNAPEALTDLESPTHVFIGGSSGNLKEILQAVKAKNPDVRIVMNVISLETMKEVMELVETGAFGEPEIVQIAVSSAQRAGRYHLLTGQNPVYVITESRKDGAYGKLQGQQ